jgi:hypothetical protein
MSKGPQTGGCDPASERCDERGPWLLAACLARAGTLTRWQPVLLAQETPQTVTALWLAQHCSSWERPEGQGQGQAWLRALHAWSRGHVEDLKRTLSLLLRE